MKYQDLFSNKVKEIKPSGIRKFFDYASTIEGCISLGVGEPDFKTPYVIRDAGIKSLEKGMTWYTSNSGLIELREEISNYLKRRFDLSYEPNEEILVTVGGSEAIDIFLRGFINPGDEVIIPTPCYVSYEPLVNLCHGKVVTLPLKVEDDFMLTAEGLKKVITKNTKAIIMNFPSNPTGGVMTKDELLKIADLLEGTNIVILSDEIYAELSYGQDHVSVVSVESLKERTVLLNGYSKAYAMTGWRLAYICANKEIIEMLRKIHQFAIMSAPTTSQYAAIVATKDCDLEVKKMVDEYDFRRRYMYNELNRIGLTCFLPKGAFYMFPSIKHTGLTSEEFALKLLAAKKVAVVPGTAFGEAGEGFLRISYSYSLAHLKEAIKKIEEFLKELKEK